MNNSLSTDNSTFDRAFSNSLGHEGGFVHDPNDAGGATKYGVCLKTYKQFHPQANAETIKNLSLKEAKAFYHNRFWLVFHYDEIENSDLAIKIFDACINMGAVQAHKCLQRALNSVGFILNDDGILGAETLQVLNRTAQPEWNFAILCAFRSEIAGFYRLLATIKPQNKKFLKGWLKRAYA